MAPDWLNAGSSLDIHVLDLLVPGGCLGGGNPINPFSHPHPNSSFFLSPVLFAFWLRSSVVSVLPKLDR